MEGNPFNWTWTSSKSPGSDDLYVNHSICTEDNSRGSLCNRGNESGDMNDINEPSTSKEMDFNAVTNSCEKNSLPFAQSPFIHESEDDSMLVNNTHREGVDESNKNKVNRATSTDFDSDVKNEKCKYCKARLSKLRWLEKVKSRRRHSFRRLSSQRRENTNKGCQTSASLFEKAEMTQKELQSIAMILRFKCSRTSNNETFCKCVMHGKERDCRCGEEDKCFEWVWDSTNRSQATNLLENNCLALFHKDYSCGTAAVKGQMGMNQDQHFWEIKMTTPVYGTDMMIGVGTEAVNVYSNSNTFCSMLGNDMDSWGLSYDGRKHHNRKKQDYCGRFGQGAIIGVHLDMWRGTLAFFKNREPLGIAFHGLRGRTVYPMACSTAARSGVKIISSRSFPTSLQFMCCQTIRRNVPSHLSVLDALAMPPGLRAFLANNMTWLLHALPPRFVCQDFICSICLPLKGALEGLTDDEDSDDDRIDVPTLHLADSDNESEDEVDTIQLRSTASSSVSDLYNRFSRGSLDCSFTRPASHKTFSAMSQCGVKRRKLDSGTRSHGEEEDESSDEDETEKSQSSHDIDGKDAMGVEDSRHESEIEVETTSGSIDDSVLFPSKKRKRI